MPNDILSKDRAVAAALGVLAKSLELRDLQHFVSDDHVKKALNCIEIATVSLAFVFYSEQPEFKRHSSLNCIEV